MSSPFIFSHEHAPAASNSARAVHLRRLFDIMELSIQREDTTRAHRAFAILARCPEVKWKAMWRLAILLISKSTQRPGAVVEFLETLDLPAQSEQMLQEIVLAQIVRENYGAALEKLEGLMEQAPFESNPVLHTYFGLLWLYMSQLPEQSVPQSQYSQFPTMASDRIRNIRHADIHFNKALALDPDNTVAREMLQWMRSVEQRDGQTGPGEVVDVEGLASESAESEEDDSDSDVILLEHRPSKRARHDGSSD